jgi:hypothetical protein
MNTKSIRLVDDSGSIQIREMTDKDWEEVAKLAQEQTEILAVERIPPSTIASIRRFAFAGIEPGDFVRAILCNDLKGAVGRADIFNMKAIPAIVSYCYNVIPAASWGSEAKMEAWLERYRTGGEYGEANSEA